MLLQIQSHNGWDTPFRPLSSPTYRSMARSILQAEKACIKVAIVGGGMCGMACAIALARNGVEVEIYEAAVCQAYQRI